MPNRYVDPDGNEVETLTPEEAKELQDKFSAAEIELGKLRDKDLNFSEFRKKTQEEQEKEKETWDGKTKALYGEVENLRSTIEENNKKELDRKQVGLKSLEDELLGQIAGTDEEYKAKIKERVKNLNYDLESEQGLQQGLMDAATLVKGVAPAIKPLHRFVPSTNQSGPTEQPNFVATPEGQDIINQFNIPKK